MAEQLNYSDWPSGMYDRSTEQLGPVHMDAITAIVLQAAGVEVSAADSEPQR